MERLDQRYGDQFLNHAARALAIAAIVGVPSQAAAIAAMEVVQVSEGGERQREENTAI